MKLLPWAVAIGLAGLAMYAIGTGRLHTSESTFLGIREREGLGLDDFAKGAVVVGLAALGGKMIHSFLPAVPVGVKV